MPWETARKDPAYGTAAWRHARDACLRRANWRCEIRLQGVCIGAASEADHIDQLANDPDHKQLRAACKPCHKAITAQQGNVAKYSRKDPKPTPRTAW